MAFLDCQTIISTLMRHAVTSDDDQLMEDLRILESSIHTRHFRNALSVRYTVEYTVNCLIYAAFV